LGELGVKTTRDFSLKSVIGRLVLVKARCQISQLSAKCFSGCPIGLGLGRSLSHSCIELSELGVEVVCDFSLESLEARLELVEACCQIS